MGCMTDKQLEKWAEAIVDLFFTEAVSLNDGVIKTAEQESLNPEQIKRLIEAVNTSTFLQKFNNPEPDANGRVVEFETASPHIVTNRMLNSAKNELQDPGCTCLKSPCVCAHEDKSDLARDLPVTRADESPLPAEKVASAAPEPRVKRHIVINRLHKTATVFRDREYQARVSFTETVQSLTDRFRQVNGASFEEFEKDAFYHFGAEAAPHLQLLRQALRKSTAEYDHDAMTKTARFVELRTPEMQQLQEMMSLTSQRKQADAGLKKVEEYLARAC